MQACCQTWSVNTSPENLGELNAFGCVHDRYFTDVKSHYWAPKGPRAAAVEVCFALLFSFAPRIGVLGFRFSLTACRSRQQRSGASGSLWIDRCGATGCKPERIALLMVSAGRMITLVSVVDGSAGSARLAPGCWRAAVGAFSGARFKVASGMLRVCDAGRVLTR